MTSSVNDDIFRALRKASESHLHEIIQQCGPLLKVNQTKKEQDVSLPAVVINDEHQNVIEFLLRRLKDHTHIGHRYKNTDSKNYLLITSGYLSPKTLNYENVLSAAETEIIVGLFQQPSNYFIMEYLIDVAKDEPLWLEFVLDSVVESSDDLQEKIVALELMGAVFIYKKTLSYCGCDEYKNEGLLGLECWKKVSLLRNSMLITPKTARNISEISRNAFANIVESMTSEKMEQLEQCVLPRQLQESFDADETHNYWEILCQSLRSQALLLIQQTFSQNNPQQISFSWFHLKILVDLGYNSRDINIRYRKGYLAENYFILSTDSPKYFLMFYETFKFMFDNLKRLQLVTSSTEKKSTSNFLSTFEFGLSLFMTLQLITINRNDKKVLREEGLLEELYHLIKHLIVNWILKLNHKEFQQLKRSLSHYMQFFNNSKRSDNLDVNNFLHMAMEDYNAIDFRTESFVQTARLLIEAGADPSIPSGMGRPSLHILIQYFHFPKNVFQLLVDAGGHLNQPCSSGETVLARLKWLRKYSEEEKLYKKRNICYSLPAHFNFFINTVLPLSCYCSQVIVKNRIPFKEHLPLKLQKIVAIHTKEYVFDLLGLNRFE